MWYQHYQPQKIEDIVSQDEFKSIILQHYKKRELPHLLLYGPPGTGKTTAAYCIANLYNCNGNFIEVNGSDERSVEKMRVLVSNATKHTPIGAEFKVILLDESDGLLRDTQELLRRVIEKSVRTKFILTCNDVEKIIRPLRERLIEIEFKPIPMMAIEAKLKEIAKKENLKLPPEKLKGIALKSEGSLRKAINELQKIAF